MFEKKHGVKLAFTKKTKAHPFTGAVINREVNRRLKRIVARQINQTIKNVAR